MMQFTSHNLQCTIIATVFVLTSCAAKSEWQLVWSDEFETESLNTASWNVEDNARGGGNAELQYYAPKNITIENHPVTGDRCLGGLQEPSLYLGALEYARKSDGGVR